MAFPLPAASGSWVSYRSLDAPAGSEPRRARVGHHTLAHLRTEAYPVYNAHLYPPRPGGELSYERNCELIEESKRKLGQ